MPNPNLPVGASQGALEAQLDTRLERARPEWWRLRRVASGASAASTFTMGLGILGSVQNGTHHLIPFFAVAGLLFGWITWRWFRGFPLRGKPKYPDEG